MEKWFSGSAFAAARFARQCSGFVYIANRVMKSGTITIDEREGNITVSRGFTYGGDNRIVFYNDSTVSQNDATVRRGDDLKSKIRWDHDVLNGAVYH
jgi:hypothetical protein